MWQVRRQVLRFIHREQLLLAGEKVVVGVSGGPDSLCLLHLLAACRDELGVELHAAHLNHLIRGPEADADARFVVEVAERWKVPCTVEARDVPAIASQHKWAVEEAARRVRYAFLLEVARREGAARIAVGHNADDQSETVLMHWLRGAGLAGLRGMLPATRMSDLRLFARPEEGPEAGNSVWLVRPLLQVPRADIERYCQECGLVPCFDRSNLDRTLYRNRLRHELLPYLESAFKPGFRQVLRRSARVIRDDYDLLRRMCDQAWKRVVQQASEQAVTFDKAAWRALHPSLQRATVRRAVQHLRWDLRDVNLEHVDAAMRVAQEGRAGAQATLPRRVMLTVGYQVLLVADASFVPPPDFPALSVERLRLRMPGQTPLPGGGSVDVEVVSRKALPAGWERNDDPWRAFLDAGVLGQRISLRRRRDGDRFCPLGLGGRHKLVSELLINDRVPAWWRDAVPLLVRDDDDEVMWVCGWRVDERAKIRDSTSQIAMVTVRGSSARAG